MNAKQYLEHKKKNLIRLVDNYNETESDKYKFQIKDKTTLDIEKEFCRPELCKKCGTCCYTFPCVFSPSDFLDISDTDYMKSILNTGLICISALYDEFDSRQTFVLRPRGYEEPYSIINLTGKIKCFIFDDPINPCIFRNDFMGCLLPPVYRPSEGLLRIPYRGEYNKKEHINMYGMWFYKEDYQEYQEYLKHLISEYKGVLFPIQDVTEKDVKKFTDLLIRK